MGNETASYASGLCHTCDGAALLPSFRGAFQEEKHCSTLKHKPPGPCHADLPELASFSAGPACCTSWESFVCMGQALTAPMHRTGSLCKQGGRRGTAGSQQAQGGTSSVRGQLAAGQQLPPCRRQSTAEHPHAHPMREALGSCRCTGPSPERMAVPERGHVKPARGGKPWLRCQTSIRLGGLQQAGSSSALQPFFWWLVGWDCLHSGLFILPSSPSAPAVKSEPSSRLGEESEATAGVGSAASGDLQSKSWWAGQRERSPDPSAIC